MLEFQVDLGSHGMRSCQTRDVASRVASAIFAENSAFIVSGGACHISDAKTNQWGG